MVKWVIYIIPTIPLSNTNNKKVRGEVVNKSRTTSSGIVSSPKNGRFHVCQRSSEVSCIEYCDLTAQLSAHAADTKQVTTD
eukprot:637420-Prorocentrum_minimum.AAC.2